MKTKGLLWEPSRIGNMELKNRIVMPPMVTRYATEDGYVTERLSNHYGARARGGVSLVIIEATCIRRQGKTFANQVDISDDKFIPGMTELAQAIHQHVQ